jgi:hypothetical protein
MTCQFQKNAILVAVLLCPLLLHSQQMRGWHPGEYRGLIMGKSTSHDLVRIFGQPSWRGQPQEVPETSGAEEWTYTIATQQGECCDVYLRDGVVESLTLRLHALTTADAEKLLDGNFVEVRFSTVQDRPQTGSGRLCEDSKGDTTLLLNASKGLSLWLDSNRRVNEAVFSVEQPGHSSCKNETH